MNTYKVLIVEDDASLIDMYRFKLEQSGFHVSVAFDGREGLEKAKIIKPDLILLDIRMPIMAGDEMLEKMRATDWGSNIHIVILTNISKDEAPMSLRLLNVDRYIVKAHYTPHQLINVINEVLNIQSKQ